MNTKPDINEILDKINNLPNVNKVAFRILRMLDDENTNIRELTEIISLDQSLTTQLLKLCNSAYFGFSKKITSINDAVVKLGFKTIKSLTFMAISHCVLNREVEGYDLCKGALWNNSITCAVYAKHLAEKAGYHDPETAFTAGLLRDIGKLIIHEYVGVNYNGIVNSVNSKGISFSEAEESVIGYNHSYIGSELAQKWNLPSDLVYAIEYHHNFNKAVDQDFAPETIQLIATIHVADALTMMSGSGIGSDGLMYNINMKSLETLNIPESSSNIEVLFSEIFELRSEIEKMIGLINER